MRAMLARGGLLLAPRNASTLESVVMAIVHMPRGAEILIAENLNTDLESPYRNKRDKAITEVMTMEGIKDTM